MDRKHRALIFDLDGTLWDTREPVIRIWNDVFEEEGYGRPLTFPLLISLMGKPMNAFGEAIFPDLEDDLRNRLVRQAEQQENTRLLETGKDCLYPDTADTLRKLSCDHWIGIASNCQEGYIETFLEVSKLGDVVDSFISNGETGLDKDENLRILMERNGLHFALYIGDTSGDRLSARKAGIPFIWCRYGFGNEVTPDGIDDLSQLPYVLTE